jgi:hypothetical protein
MAQTTLPPDDLPTRVAVLEQIARNTERTLGEMRAEFADVRTEMRAGFADMRAEFRAVRAEAKSDYRWLIGIMLGGFALTIGGFVSMAGLIGRGFHWF